MDESTLQRRRRERDAFHRLFDLPHAERETRVEEIERVDPDLAAEVRQLFAVADLDKGDVEDLEGRSVGMLVGGRFRLVRLLGIGGMGEVYLAERTDDIHRQVALKLVRGDLPISMSRARREREILARLTHPNIAGLIDAGLTDSGNPWFAMEYVDGEPLTDWSDQHATGLGARVRLFAQVCRAVQFAHRNLVLHRDLKPSNILVDADGRPKLLDFGIAKLLDANDPQQTQTLTLTPAYAAPEQLRGEVATTASDVYQLGLVLYQLLSGVSARAARGVAQLRADSSTPIPRMDKALTTFELRDLAGAERMARARGITVQKLRRSLKGDLGRIVAKATADAAHERYDTAQAFADDLDRWVDGLPVAAHRGSFAYRARKLVRRHAIAASAIFVLSIGLVLTSVVALNRAYQEHVQRQQAELEHQRADEQRQHAETLLGFLRDVFREGDPNNANGAKLSPTDLLNRAGAKLDQRTDVDDATRALLLAEIADVMTTLGEMQLAIDPAQRAFAALAPLQERYPVDYLQSALTLIQARNQLGQYAESMTTIDTVLPLAERTIGGAHRWHPYLLQERGYSLMMLGRKQEAEAELRTALSEFSEVGDKDSNDLADTLNTLAVISYDRGEFRQAISLEQQIISIAAHNPHLRKSLLLTTTGNMAGNHYAIGEARTAVEILEPLIPQLDALVGPAHSSTVYARGILVQSYLGIGDYARASTVLGAMRPALEARQAQDPETQRAIETAQAKVLLSTFHYDAALVSARKVADALQSSQRSRLSAVNTEALLGETLLQRGDRDEATRVLQAALDQLADGGDRESSRVGGLLEDCIGRAYLVRGEFALAQVHIQKAITQFRNVQGENSPNALRSEIHLLWAKVLQTRGNTTIDELASKRVPLIAALEGEAKPQIWQFDLLVDGLSRGIGRPGVDVARLGRAEAGLKEIAGTREVPPFIGLNGF